MDSLKKAFEYSITGFALVEKNGDFRHSNQALSDILGYSFEELKHINWQLITHPDDLELDLELVAEVLSGVRKGYQMGKRYIRKDGSICYAVLTVSTFNNFDGSFDCFCSQITDVTKPDRKYYLERFHKEVLAAIAANQFVLHYQEIVDLKTLKVVGYESLIRWQHPTKGLLYPNSFIEDCEQNPDVMLQLCQWVFKESCDNRHRLNGFLSLNVSPKSLLHTSFIEMVSKYISASKHISTSKHPAIFLEITERVFANLEDSQVLANLEREGCGFFVDDFGQANSGLIQVIKVMKSIRSESSIRIKIDIWFTEHLHEDFTHSSMKVLLELFREMGIQVIAEGIETKAQLKAWQDLGCDYGQGWLWGKGKALD